VTTLISMTIPDDPARLAEWLEEQLAAGELRRLADELVAINGPGTEAASLQEVCGPHLDGVYERGLAALPRAALQRLLHNPRLLPELAEQVLLHGGRYWDERLAAAPGVRIDVAESWSRLNAALDAKKEPARVVVPAGRQRGRWYSAPWFVGPLTALATAAAILVVLRLVPEARQAVLPSTDRDTAARRGWLKVDELPTNVSAADYLDRIAALAEEWRNRPADTPQALADDILALRRGCDRLQLMSHPPLTPAQTADLLARCRKWAARFDSELVALETTRDVAAVRREVSETVNSLAGALRAEADRLRRQAGAGA
jgi:hypothetical protein